MENSFRLFVNMAASLTLLAAWLTTAAAAPAILDGVAVFTGSGYFAPALSELRAALGVVPPALCLGYGQGSPATIVAQRSAGSCGAGVVVIAAVPSVSELWQLEQIGAGRVLVVAGELDGVTRFSHFAARRHVYAGGGAVGGIRFAAIRGAAHHSFANHHHPIPHAIADLDLAADITPAEAHRSVAAIIAEFARPRAEHGALTAAEAEAARLSGPVVLALELEGSAELGHPACNSDHPTNPGCKYPKWPDHSLPPGPKPAPNPALPVDCVCGSPWVAKNAQLMIAGMAISANPNAAVTTKDAFHDVSDVRPFHLPHIFNTCKAGDPTCSLNISTVTMPIVKPGALFPNSTTPPLSAFEMRTKLKSREAVWEAAGLGKQDGKKTDGNLTMCKAINQLAYTWALQHADASTLARYQKDGQPMVMVDDKVAKIGFEGPEWIQDELVYTKIGDGPAGRIEVQSWQFVVPNTNQGNDPWFFPVGMHYCKLFSPARAMEWIYLDSLRGVRRL